MSEESLHQGFVSVSDGLFQVNREGVCLHETNRGWERAYPDKDGCVYTYIRKDGKAKKWPVGRSLPKLVAEAFLPPPQPGQTCAVCKNGDRADCRADNLEWRHRSDLDLFVDHYKLDRTCSHCGAPIADHNKSGLCKRCNWVARPKRGPYHRPIVNLDAVTDESKRQICQAWNAGVSVAEISAAHGRPAASIYYLIRHAPKQEG